MSLVGKNRKIFSYNNQDRRGSNFQYKDFEKTISYHTDFSGVNFNYASLRAAHMKYCNFNDASFIGTEFVGTNLRGSTFKKAHFKNAIFNCTILDKTNFTGAVFENCLFIGTKIEDVRGLDNTAGGIKVITQNSAKDEFSDELIEVIQRLRNNDIIRRSHTLHIKNNKINAIYVHELLQEYSEEDLIALLPKTVDYITTQFYTLSYLKVLLKKASKDAKLK